jgi:glycosyltransferase involved in cell wall biosynthesis
MQPVKVSVITPCYNAGPFICQTIESVRFQTMSQWEHVIVDDGSRDDSAMRAERCAADDSRIRVIRQTNSGVSAARNRGFAAASPRSEFLLFLDADDVLEPAMLEVLCQYLRAHPRVGLVYCAARFIDEHDHLESDSATGLGWYQRRVPTRLGVGLVPDSQPNTPFESIYGLTHIVPSCSLIRREAFLQSGRWDESFGQHFEDTDLFLRVALRWEVHWLADELVRYRRRPGQSSSRAQVVQTQGRKLDAKLLELARVMPEYEKIITRAIAFRRYRSGPLGAVADAAGHLRHGRWAQCLRGLAGAAWRYPLSFLPPLWLR